MKILIRPLRDGFPKAVHGEYDPKELDLEFVDLIYLEPVYLNGWVEKFENTLTFKGNLTGRTESTCARCLKHIEKRLDQPFEFVYDIQGKEEIDSLEDIRETLILEHPIRYLCQENCAGLCPQCGADLNEGACLHAKS